jgi:hypothetical protein
MTEASGGGRPAEMERRLIQRSYLVLPSTAEGAE